MDGVSTIHCHCMYMKPTIYCHCIYLRYLLPIAFQEYSKLSSTNFQFNSHKNFCKHIYRDRVSCIQLYSESQS